MRTTGLDKLSLKQKILLLLVNNANLHAWEFVRILRVNLSLMSELSCPLIELPDVTEAWLTVGGLVYLF